MSNNKLNTLIESICGEGCVSVNIIIKELEQGKINKHANELEPNERFLLIKELKEIMSVYENK